MNDRDDRSQRSKPEAEERLLARRYMLGGLSAQQQDEVERRFLFDSAFQDIVLEEETDLFDALAAGALSSEHERALRVWASSQQRTQSRLDAAFVFNRLTSKTEQQAASRVPAARSWLDAIRAHRFSALWLTGVVVASVAMLTATLWVTRRHPVTQVITSVTASQPAPITATSAPSSAREAGAPAPPAPLVTAATARANSVVTIFLMAEETRSASAPPRLHFKPGTRAVMLQLGSQTGLPAGRNAVELKSTDGSAIQPTDVHSRRLHGESFLEVTLDATALRPGDYTVLLHQTNTPDQKNTLGLSSLLTYHFQVVAP